MTVMTAFDVFFLTTLSFLTISVAAWNGYEKSEIVYKWMEVDFIAIILFRILVTMEHVISSGIRLDFCGENGHRRARSVVLSVLYMILYPFLWAWNTIGFVWWFTSSEKDMLGGLGLHCCYFLFLILCSYELFCFACSSAEKHMAPQRQPLGCSEHSGCR